MTRKVSIGEFLSTLALGVWQFICWVCKAFDPRNKTTFWRVIWGIWTGVAILFLIAACIVAWQEISPTINRELDKKWLSGNVYWQQVSRGDDYIYNEKTGKKTLKGLSWCVLPDEGDSLAVFFKEGKRGYFNIYTGEVVVSPTYDFAWISSEGVAMAAKADSLYLINSKGQALASFWFSRSTTDCEEENNYVFHDGVCIINTPNHKYGLIDKSGAWAVAAEYSSLQRIEYEASVVYKVAKPDTVNGGYVSGVIDNAGNELIPCIYKTLEIDDTEGIFVTDAQHYQWKSDLHGNLSDEPLCYSVSELEYTVRLVREDCEGMSYDTEVSRNAPLYSYTTSSEGYKGLMDASGHRITPPLFINIRAINDNLYCCGYDYQFDHAVLLDAKGNVVK